MEFVHEIRRAFANLAVGHFLPIEFPCDLNVWVYRIDSGFGVAVDMADDQKISERFATARMYTREDSIAGKLHHFLALENTEEALRNEFAAICAQFADPGKNGDYRKQLCADPVGWWSKWKKLIGNSVREKTTHGVLGELLVYSLLLTFGKKSLWKGPERHSHDLECEDADYEVKSTVVRYGTTITISGQYQLESTAGKPLKIAFCRFEEVSGDGISIDGLIENLTEQGVAQDDINQKLCQLGYETGCSARRQQYVLHEGIRVYEVDDSFPRITSDSFVGKKIPERIIQLTYQLDLTSLPYRLLEMKPKS